MREKITAKKHYEKFVRQQLQQYFKATYMKTNKNKRGGFLARAHIAQK